MGSLVPGATYTYESPDNGDTIYARIQGEKERKIIGMSFTAIAKRNKDAEDKLWNDIREAAKTNPTLQKEMDRVILMYKLSKETYE